MELDDPFSFFWFFWWDDPICYGRGQYWLLSASGLDLYVQWMYYWIKLSNWPPGMVHVHPEVSPTFFFLRFFFWYLYSWCTSPPLIPEFILMKNQYNYIYINYHPKNIEQLSLHLLEFIFISFLYLLCIGTEPLAHLFLIYTFI